MNNHLRTLSSILSCGLLAAIAACDASTEVIEERPGATSVEFSFNVLPDKAASAMDKALEDSTAVLVSIEDDQGNPVYTLARQDLFEFSGDYVAQPLSLLPGNYQLTEFVVIDGNDDALYVAPVDASPLAYLVDIPLPVAFGISTDTVTTVRPQVLSTETFTPEDFGYTGLGIGDDTIVDVFDFLIAAQVYNPGTSALEMTTADLDVQNENGDSLFQGPMIAGTNQITVQDGHAEYHIAITKSGYETFTTTMTAAELAAHFDSNGSGPLIAVLQEPVESLIENATATARTTANAPEDASGNPMRAVDGSGIDAATGAHDIGSWPHSWVSGDQGGSSNLNEWFQVDLGCVRELTRTRIYNGNEPGYGLLPLRRIAQADLYVSADETPGAVPTDNQSGNGWTLVTANAAFTQASGRNDYGANPAYAMPDEFDLSGLQARHVALNIDAQGGMDQWGVFYVQIAEFQVFAQGAGNCLP